MIKNVIRGLENIKISGVKNQKVLTVCLKLHIIYEVWQNNIHCSVHIQLCHYDKQIYICDVQDS